MFLPKEHTLNRDDGNAFYRWLDTVSLDALRETLQKIEAALVLLKNRDVRTDALKMRCEIEAEILDQSRR